jgi:hypothetical protein
MHHIIVANNLIIYSLIFTFKANINNQITRS